MTKTIIFDFDGTLADTPKFIHKLFREIKDEIGLSHIKEEDFLDFRDKTMKELIKQTGLPFWKITRLVRTLHQSMNQLIDQVDFNPGVESMLNTLSAQGFQLGIMSSNTTDNIQQFLEQKNNNHFDFIYTGSNLFGKHKVLTRLIREQSLKKNQIIYVGDEVRDIQACQKINLEMIAVDWGMNSRKFLAQYDPDHLISSPSDIVILSKKIRANHNS